LKIVSGSHSNSIDAVSPLRNIEIENKKEDEIQPEEIFGEDDSPPEEEAEKELKENEIFTE